MSLLLGFAPFVVFSVLARLSVSLALWLAFATVFTFAIRSFVETSKLRMFDAACIVIFGLLSLYDGFIEPGMSVAWVGMVVELSLLGVAIWSLATRKPFTAPYLPPLPDQEEGLLLGWANVALTAIWAAAFAVMAGADAATTFVHTISPNWTAGVGLVALAGALTFTWQFGVYIGRRLGRTPSWGRR